MKTMNVCVSECVCILYVYDDDYEDEALWALQVTCLISFATQIVA